MTSCHGAAIAERHPQGALDLPARERIIGRRGQEGTPEGPVLGAARPAAQWDWDSLD